MFERHPNPIAFRGFMVLACLALLAGCLPRTNPVPAVPASLAATAGNAMVSLTWTASPGATAYNVKRATTSGGPYGQLAAPTAAAFTDTGLTNGTTYYYVVSSLDAAGESANSAQVSAAPEAPPAVPANVTATPANASVILNWTASPGATGYNVKRATTSGGPYTQLAAPTTTTYTDSGLTNGTTYYYVVSAFDAVGESANSAQVSAIPAVATVPAAPTNLSGIAGNAQASLTWTASTGATSYNVKRATTNGGPYTQIAAPTTPSYLDTGLTNNTNYYYVVSAVNAAGESPNSAQVSVVPTVSNPPPTTFGTWVDVTPAGVNLTAVLCGNAGTQSAQADSSNPGTVYAQFNCQGVWKSTDYGLTWTGPINTGSNAAAVSDCVGGVTVSPGAVASAPTIYQGCIRGNGVGFWKSVDGGVNWTNYPITPTPSRQDYYPPVIDPYDPTHLVMSGHEQDSIVESLDGGQTWNAVSLNSGMLQNGRTGFIFFINTGTAATTRGTWLWLAEQNGGGIGTWRTTNSGTNWTQVDNNEHLLGSAQIYQPDSNGVVYMAGAYSVFGFGVLRSGDYGQTWTHAGMMATENLVFGTSKNVYAMGTGTNDPLFEVASQPGTGAWVSPGTPAGLTQGVQVSVLNNGTNNVFVGAMQGGGVWRYVEP